MMTRLIIALAFILGGAAVVLMWANFFPADTLALTVTAVIGGVYLIGAIELLQFRRATSTLTRALAELSAAAAEGLGVIDQWLIKLHPSLQHAARQRVEGDRVALPAPVLTPYLVSLLVMLGLLGTFVGLVETLKGVVVALQGSTELDAIRQALTAPMGGLQLAFGTSVAGVAASAMLGLMATLSRRDRMLATRALDARIATDLCHFSLTHQRRETFKALQVQSQALPLIADKLEHLATHMERANDRLGGQLIANQDRFHESVQTMYRELATSLDQSLRASVAKTDNMLAESGRLVGEGIAPVVQQAMVAISSEIGRSVEDTHRQLSQTVQDHMQLLSERFAQTSTDVAQAWGDGLAAHQQSNAAMIQDMAASLGGFRDEFGSTAAGMLAAINATTNAWSTRQQADEQQRLQRWTDTLQRAQQHGAQQLVQAASGIIAELHAATGTQQVTIKALSEDLGTLYTELTAQLRESGEQAVVRQQALTTTLDTTTRAVVDNAQVESSRVLGAMTGLLSTTEALIQARVETERTWIDGHEQRVAQLTATLRDELAGLRDDEAQRGKAATDRMSALESTVAGHLATLGKALEDPMTHLIEIASETPRVAAEVIGKLRQEVSNNIERDNQLLAERGRMMSELNAVSESLARSSTAQVAAIEKLVDASGEHLQQIGAQFSQQVGVEVAKVSDVVDHFAVSAVELASLGEAFSVAMDLYKDSNVQLVTSLRAIETSLAQSNSRSDEQLAYYVAQARELIDYSVLTQKEIFDELRQLKLHANEAYEPAGVN